MDKFFCDDHWSTEPHGLAPTFTDAGDRMHERLPEAVTCSFCDKPATHQAESLAKKPSIAPEAVVTKKSIRP